MGIESSSPQKLDLWDGPNNIINEKSIIHRLYGENVKIFKSEANEKQKYALITQTFNNEHSYERQKNQAQFIKEFDNQHTVKLINYSSYQKNEFCSSFWELKFLFEFLNNDLEKDIKLRIKYYNKHYEENELIYICYSVISSLRYMQSQGVFHGDICPSNILIDFEGKIKLMLNKIITTQNNFMYMLGIDAYRCYLSPKQLEIMKTQNKTIPHDINKSDLFSLGVILMEAALLKNMDEIYYKKMFELNEFKIQLNLKKIKEKYSQQLYDIIQMLLIQDEQERPSSEKCFEIIEDQQLKGLQVAAMLYSMNEVMKDPINLLINPSINNQQGESKKDISDIQPITHSNIEELKSLENNNDQNIPNDSPKKEENKSNQEYIPPQDRMILDQQQPIKNEIKNNEQVTKQQLSLNELRANLQKSPSQSKQFQDNQQFFSLSSQYNQQRQIYNQ